MAKDPKPPPRNVWNLIFKHEKEIAKPPKQKPIPEATLFSRIRRRKAK